MKFLYLLFFVFFHANASDKEIPDYKSIHKPFWDLTCLESKSQSELDLCVKKSLDDSTTDMNRILNALISSNSEPEYIKLLKNSQQTWLNHMDSTCELQTYESIGGSGFFSILNDCLETETNERISFLSLLINNP